MECKQVSDSIPVWMDSALPPEESAAVGQHLARCAQCRQEFKDYTNMWSIIKSLPDIEPSPGYVERFWKQVSYQEPWPQRFLKKLQLALTDKAFVPSLIAIVAFFVIAGFTLYQSFVITKTETVISNLSADDIDFIEHMDMANDFEVVKDLELLQDLEQIAKIYNQKI